MDRFQVKYLVVGGYAVMKYTEPRYTKDLDIAVGIAPSNIEGVRQALKEFGFPMSDEAADQLKLPNSMISIGRAPSRIDILNEVKGIDFNQAWDRRNLVDIGGQEVAFISLADLIAAKEAAGRKQDLVDLTSLRKGLA
ncbi:MAG: nucleotidyltransferase [Fimbriimonadaceae bacterium]|nr:nucleotidyltransferase [Fimbriimonadaceae bacterium]